MMHFIKVWLSAHGWFPTFRVCAKCKCVYGIRWGVAVFPLSDWIEKTHGVCDKCGPKLYGDMWGGI